MAKTKINDAYFRELFQERGLTIQSVAKKLGMPQHTSLSLTLSGKRKMQLGEAVALSQILSVPLSDVVTEAGYPLNRGSKGIPVIGILRGDGTVEPSKDVLTRAVLPEGLPAHVVAIQARTSDTPLSWMDRFVFFADAQEKPGPNSAGRFCLASSKGTMRLGVLRPGYSAGTFAITGPDHREEAAKIEWIRPILMTRNV